MTEALDLDIETGAELLCERLSSTKAPNGKIEIDPDNIEQDLARLVLGLMEFLRQLMELRAIHRFSNGTLTEEQEECLGTALMRSQDAIQDVAAKFDLRPEDLSLDLGPLGKTV